MKNSKGFTLIELLAVILILGLIALIAIPSASKVIDQSKKGSFELTANNLVDGAETSCTTARIGGKIVAGTYSISDGQVVGLKVDMQGQLPASGTLNIDANCNVSIYTEDNSGKWVGIKTFQDERVRICNVGEECPGIEEYQNEPINEVSNNTCFTYENNSTGVTITGYNFDDPKCSRDIIVPTSIDGKNVTKLADFAFINKSGTIIEHIMFDASDGGRTGDYNIYGYSTGIDYPNPTYHYYLMPEDINITGVRCHNGTEWVNLPADYRHTAGDGYGSCRLSFSETFLSHNVNIPVYVRSIDFSKATHITSIPKGLALASGVTSVRFNNAITSIESSAFIFNNLSRIDFPDSLQTIGPSAFEDNNLGRIDLKNVLSIGELAFASNGTYEIIYSPNMTEIPNFAFELCAISHVDFPSNIVKINQYAYAGSTINSVHIPGTLKIVGDYAFEALVEEGTITSLVIDEGVEVLGVGAFAHMQAKSVTVPSTIKESTAAFYGADRLETVVLTDGIKKLGNNMFLNARHLKALHMPNSITEIGYQVCDGCYSLKELTLSSQLTKIPLRAFNSTQIEHLVIPNSVKTIEYNAFYGARFSNYPDDPGYLKTLTLGNNLTTIGNYAFMNNSLTEINLPSKVKTIGKYAFANYEEKYGVENVTINAGSAVTSIGQKAFDYMKSGTLNIARAEGKVTGAPWGASNLTINWTGTN